MTKSERIQQINLAAKLETVIDSLNKAISPVESKERVCIICEQITTLHGIIGDILKGDGANE